MNRNTRIFCFLVLTLAALGGCSSKPAAKESKKAAAALDKIQGKAQVLVEPGGATRCRSERGWTFCVPYGKATAATACSCGRPSR